jgi:hypothetical protein
MQEGFLPTGHQESGFLFSGLWLFKSGRLRAISANKNTRGKKDTCNNA